MDDQGYPQIPSVRVGKDPHIPTDLLLAEALGELPPDSAGAKALSVLRLIRAKAPGRPPAAPPDE